MKQKIVIKVQMSSESSKSKALKIAAEAHGVESVALEGSDKTRVVVIGENVDSVKLTSSLRNKVGHAEIISVAEVKPAPTSREKEKEKMRKEEAAKKVRREEAAKKVKPAPTREKEREKEKERERAKERKKKAEAVKQAEAKETKTLINLLRARLAM